MKFKSYTFLLLLLLISTVFFDSVDGLKRKKKGDKNKSRQIPEEKEDEEAKRAHLTGNHIFCVKN